MNDLIQEYISTGKTPNEILKEKIKTNNRQWMLIFSLFIVIWIGYICIINHRVEQKYVKHTNCDSIHKIDQLTIEMLKQANDSAVYFYEILK